MKRTRSIKFVATLVKTFTKGLLSGCVALLVVGSITAVASAGTRTLRIVSYNIDADQSQSGAQFALPQPGLIAPYNGTSVTNGGVLEAIGEEIVNGDPAQPIDVL